MQPQPLPLEAGRPPPFDPAPLFDALPYALLLTDRQGVIVWVNAAAEEWAHSSARKLCGQKLEKITPLAALAGRAAEERMPVTDYTQEGARGAVRAVPVEEGVLLIVEPETHGELFKMEQSHDRVAKASALIGAMLAHEIKNPLAGIKGAAQLMAEDALGGDAALPLLICREAERIRDIVERVEGLSDGEGLALEAVNVHAGLRHAKETVRAALAGDIAWAEDFDPSLPEVLAHRIGLEQLWMNLFANAREALADAPLPAITVKTAYADGRVAVEVRDNGAGVAEHLRETLFAPFVSSKGRGRGLGLAVAYRLAADMGGQLELLPQESGRGAAFRVSLRVAA